MKKSLLFDATILSKGLETGGNRSGIYFVAFNILKEFLKKNNFEIFLYCDQEQVTNLKNVLKKYFPKDKMQIVSSPGQSLLVLYEKLKEIKQLCKEQNLYIFKKIIQLILMFVSIKMFFDRAVFIKKSTYDIYFSPWKNFSGHSKILFRKKYTILYDTIPLVLENYRYHLNGWIGELIKSLSSKDYYFAISDSAKNDFLKYCPQINPNNIITTLLACNETFKNVQNVEILKVKEKYNIPQEKKYIFSLSNLDPRKNMVRAVKTFIDFVNKNNIQDMIFVIGGAGWNELIEKLQKGIPNFDNYKHLLLKAGYVNDEDLAPLYSGAEWFVYTSQYEGFGLPPLEAMSCGCPVITSNNSSG